jgi:hypothetical protein
MNRQQCLAGIHSNPKVCHVVSISCMSLMWSMYKDLDRLLNIGGPHSESDMTENLMGEHLSSSEVELDVQPEGTCMVPELGGGNVSDCMTPGLELNMMHASLNAEHVDEIVDDVLGGAAPLQFQNNGAEDMQIQTRGKRPNKKRRRSGNVLICGLSTMLTACLPVLYITNDRSRSKAHSERASRLVRVVRFEGCTLCLTLVITPNRSKILTKSQGRSFFYTLHGTKYCYSGVGLLRLTTIQ